MIRSLLCALLGLCLWSCATTRSPSSIQAPDTKRRAAVPEWVGAPLSWDKLEDIESWMATEASSSSGFWRVQAELELAQGRLEFLESDQGPSRAKLQERLRLAQNGFANVAANPHASANQKASARRGLEALGAEAQPTQHGWTAAVIARQRWGAAAAVPARLTRSTGRWRRVTVHHSAEAAGLDLDGSLSESSSAIQRIQQHQISNRRFGDIGYHYLIDPEGRVFEGRQLTWQGAHAAGANNVENIGVCLLGNFVDVRPTARALTALSNTLDHLRRVHGVKRSNIYAHADLKNTLCPGRQLARWLKTYR